MSNIKGNIKVKEVFGEILLPLLANADWMQQMNLDVAVRWADYTGSGDIWAWKSGLDMQFTEEFRFRTAYSRDVRAANLSERFDKTGGSATIEDPLLNEIYNVTRFSGGNPNVAPEQANTFTAGFVYQPGFIEGLSVAVDYYDIQIDGAIGQLGIQAVVNQCHDGADKLCEMVTRNPDDNRLILIGDVFINVDESVVNGFDLELAYSRAMNLFGSGDEYLQARLLASFLEERSEKNTGSAKTDRAGQTGIQQSDGVPYALPDMKITANLRYTYGSVTGFLQVRYISSGTIENSLLEGVDIENNKVSSALYTDLNLSYLHKTSRSSWELYANITNMFDENPPIAPYYSVLQGYTTQTNASLFDLLGRRFTAGLRFSF